MVASAAASTNMGVRDRKADDRSSVVFHVVLVAKILQFALWINGKTVCDSADSDLQRVGGGQHCRRVVAGEISQIWLEPEPIAQSGHGDLRGGMVADDLHRGGRKSMDIGGDDQPRCRRSS